MNAGEAGSGGGEMDLSVTSTIQSTFPTGFYVYMGYNMQYKVPGQNEYGKE